MSTKRDYYEILGVAKTASDDEIKKSYRKLSMKYHPDRLADKTKEEQDEGEASFKEAKEAYEKLSNPQTRAAYDQYGHQDPSMNGFRHGANSANASDLEEMLSKMFGTTGHPFGDIFGQQARQPRRRINIDLEKAYTGATYRDNDIHIQLPPGIRDGTKFAHGSIIYVVAIAAHPVFMRANDDLLVDTTINAIEAMLGVDVILEHLDKTQLQFTIPAGIQGGQIVRLGGRGMKNPESDRVGDLLIRVTVTIPQSLSDEQRATLKAIMGHRESFNI